jgi:hypothetical protein
MDMEINKRGLYTIVQLKPGLFKILILFHKDPNAKELSNEFTDTGDAIRLMNLHAPFLKKVSNDDFKTMWRAFRAEQSLR